MLVANWMSSRLISILPDDSLPQANKVMRQNSIRRLPVIDKKGRLVGIVSDRDLKRAWASDATTLEVHELAYLLGKVKVKEIMTKAPAIIGPDDTIEEAAQIMLEKNISGLPVVNREGAVVAMLTQSDIFRALVLLTGVTSGGVQFAFNLPDEAGSIKRVADVIRRYGGRMVSILSSSDRTAPSRRQVFIRMKNVDRSKLEQIRDELTPSGELVYILDGSGPSKRLLFTEAPGRPAAPAGAAASR
ncbi:MAG: CBS and ACT domain-containing protein [Thermodesulfobacteriota bacterium]